MTTHDGSVKLDEYRLPNGVVIHRGGRVRGPRAVIWQIPEADRAMFMLGRDYSPDSEVLEWAAPPVRGST